MSAAPETPGPLRLIPASAGLLDAPGMLVRALRRTPLVLSFPKAGRTWLRVMLDELGISAEYTHFGAGVARALPFEALRANPLWCARRPSLLLVRDPRDTLVSSYFQATKRRGVYSGELSAFARDPRFGIEKIVRWNLMWAELGVPRERFVLLEYEALHGDAHAALAAAARFFGAEPSEADLERALAAGRIDVMRAREQSGAYQEKYQRRLAPGDPADPESFKVRRGKVGGFREQLDAADVALCQQVLRAHEYWSRLTRALRERGLHAPLSHPA